MHTPSVQHRNHSSRPRVTLDRLMPPDAQLTPSRAAYQRLREAEHRRPHHPRPHRDRAGDRDRPRAGDLSENGDYHAAKEEQGKMEGRIRHLEALLEDAEIVEGAAAARMWCAAGSIVDDPSTRATRRRRRALPRRLIEERTEDLDVISPGSPLGEALLGAVDGDTVVYEAPTGCSRSRSSRSAERVEREAARRRSRCRRAAVELPGRGRTFIREIDGPERARPSCCCTASARTADLNWFPLVPVALGAVSGDRDRPPRARPRHPLAAPFRLEDCADDVVALADALGVARSSPSATRWAGRSRSSCGAGTANESMVSCSARRPLGSRRRPNRASGSSDSAASRWHRG